MDNGEKKCLSCGYTPEGKEIHVESGADKIHRPVVLHGSTYREPTKLGKAYVTVNSNGNGPADPLEVFVNVGKAGSEVSAVSEAVGRLISLNLRLPSTIPHLERLNMVADELDGVGGRPQGFGKERVRSLPDAIAQSLRAYSDSVTTSVTPEVSEVAILSISSYDICPECGGASYVHADGCGHCQECGFSAC